MADRMIIGNLDPPFDSVFVRDLVLPVRIGVRRDERNGTQRVRFSVELFVTSAPRQPRSLDDVVSYDFIVDGVKAIVERGHVYLAETLAERIANHCLAHERAAAVRVTVEKLDRIPGAALGTRIMRFRSKPRESTQE
jgi:dihydroneopterin aldolase